VLLDGAAWHRSSGTQELLRHLKIPAMISAPHSFEISPCELVFAALKKGNINPESRHFSQKVSTSSLF